MGIGLEHSPTGNRLPGECGWGGGSGFHPDQHGFCRGETVDLAVEIGIASRRLSATNPEGIPPGGRSDAGLEAGLSGRIRVLALEKAEDRLRRARKLPPPR